MAEQGDEGDRIAVRHPAAVGQARRVARARAAAAGFGDRAVEEIALVATELASNLVKHAGEGIIRIFELPTPPGGLGMESTDHGPGIRDPEDAMADGVSTASSLGYGLGTINRLMDEVEITSVPTLERGTRVVCRRRLRERAPAGGEIPLSFGATVRPHPGAALSGDTYLVKRWGENALVAAFDGLGHGQWAFRASQTARDYVERHYDAHLQELFAGTNRACRGTRGLVMAVARFDLAGDSFAFGSVGNIEARLWGGEERRGLLAQRGVVGLSGRPPVVQHHPWGPESILVLHSDGLSSHWSWDEFALLRDLPAMEGAALLFARLASRRDDAVVVVVKGDPG